MKAYITRDQYLAAYLLALKRLGLLTLSKCERDEFGTMRLFFSPNDKAQQAADMYTMGIADPIQPKVLNEAWREWRELLKKTRT